MLPQPKRKHIVNADPDAFPDPGNGKPSRMEEAEAQNSRFLSQYPAIRQLLDLLPEPILLLNREGSIIFANRAFLADRGLSRSRTLAGLDPCSLLGCPDHKRASPEEPVYERPCLIGQAVVAARRGLTFDRKGVFEAVESGTESRRLCSSLLQVGNDTHILLATWGGSAPRELETAFGLSLEHLLSEAGGLRGIMEFIERIGGMRFPAFHGKLQRLLEAFLEEVRVQELMNRVVAGTRPAESGEHDLGALLIEQLRPLVPKMARVHKSLVLDLEVDALKVTGDARLIGEVVQLVVRHALQAAAAYAEVFVSAEVLDGRRFIKVHYPGFIPRDEQLALFRTALKGGHPRCESTLHAAAILCHHGLGAELGFESDRQRGTTFLVALPEDV